MYEDKVQTPRNEISNLNFSISAQNFSNKLVLICLFMNCRTFKILVWTERMHEDVYDAAMNHLPIM